MSSSIPSSTLLNGMSIDDFDIASLDDEIRVDRLCTDLIKRLFRELTEQQGYSPELAGDLCHGVDYFLREFIIAFCNENLFSIDPVRIRQFGGHWYIIRTVEPNLTELKNILDGTAVFYRILTSQQIIDEMTLTQIVAECKEIDFYQRRIEDFWAIKGDGYTAWREACPLQSSNRPS